MRITNKLLTVLAAFSMLLAGSLGFSGSGSGTSTDPYEISTCSELQEMQDDLTAYYELVSNIDCSGTSSWNYNSSLGVNQGFDPVGDFENQFDGELNGNKYQIDSLYIKRNETEHVGLIGYLGNEGYVYNLTMNNADVNGSSRVGAVIGYSRGNSSNLSSSGSIEGLDDVGGLIGYLSKGKLNLSSSTADVSGGDRSYDSLGGLTGYAQYAQISKSYFEGTVTGQSKGGGISGYAHESNINFSYSNGSIDVTGDDAGGLTGDNGNILYSGNIFNSYSHSDVEIDGGSVGGISVDTDGKVYNSFSTGTVTDTQNSNNIGGAIGDEDASPDDKNLYWDTQSSGVSTSVGGTGLTTSEMQGLACSMIGLYPGNWTYRSGEYPQLDHFASGTGISGNCEPKTMKASPRNSDKILLNPPNLSVKVGDRNNEPMNVTFFDASDDSQIGSIQTGIESEENASVRWNGLSRGNTYSWYVKVRDGTTESQSNTYSFDLERIAGGNGSEENPYQIDTCQQLQNVDIDLTSNYELISDIDCSSFSFNAIAGDSGTYGGFSATFDGRNHTIDSLTMDEGEDNSAGLFARTDGGSLIKHVGLTNVDIEGDSGTGALVGDPVGPIIETFSTGVVRGKYGSYGYSVDVGGLVGGYSGDTVQRSYSHADVQDVERRVGGLAGSVDVNRSYSTGFVDNHSTSNAGGLTGTDAIFGYWDKDTSGMSDGDGTPLSTAEITGGDAVCNMRRMDFEDVWLPITSDYPELRRFTTNSGVDLSTLNCPPLKPRNFAPQATGSSSVSLKVEVFDQDADDMNVTFYNASDDSQIGSTQTNIPDEESASVTWSDLSREIHRWYAKVEDEDGTNESQVFKFHRFAGGSGTEADPYEVSTCKDLEAIGYSQQQYYELVNDIDCSDTKEWNSIRGRVFYEPSDIDEMQSNEDENGRPRLNMTFSAKVDSESVTIEGNPVSESDYSVDYSGGFLYIDDETIFDGYDSYDDVKITYTINDTYKQGFRPIGRTEESLKGYLTGFTDLDPDILGNFSGSLYGNNHTVKDLWINRSFGSLEHDVGLFGHIGGEAHIENLGVERANISGEETVGILSGAITDNSFISKVYTSGVLVDGQYYLSNAGGLAGDTPDNSVIITRSYSLADVNGSGDNLGGLVGENNDHLNTVFSAGYVNDSHGGLTGEGVDGTYEDSYWDVNSSNSSSSDEGINLTTPEMTGNAAPANMAGFDFSNNWSVVVGHPLRPDYPALKWQGLGNGTAEDPYKISSCEELQKMEHDLQAYYVLDRDLDCSGTSSWNGGKGFDPVGNESSPFEGGLDGNGSKVRNLYIDRSEDKVGLFGETSGAKVENISLESVSITGDSNVGGIAGLMDAGSEVNTTYVNGTITGNSNVGGIAGNIETSEIKESYDVLELQGGSNVGGLTAVNNISVVNESYSAAEITSGTSIGGLVGQDASGDIEAGYWDHEIGPLGSAGGIGLNTTEMQGCSAANHLANLDFEYTWGARSSDYPVFRWTGLNDADCAVMNWTAVGDVEGFKIYDNSTGSYQEIADVPEKAINGEVIDGWIERPSSGYICYRVTAYVKPYSDVTLESDPSNEVCRSW